MGTVNDPEIEIAWFDDPDWVDVKGYASSFNIRDAGVLKVPAARVTLKNAAGRFTDGGADDIPKYAKFRIRADVRGVWDTPFAGRYVRYEGNMSGKKETVTLVLKGHGQKLLHDAITYPYRDDYDAGDPWTMKTMIENFLASPDSGYDTGITLSTDVGDIATEPPIDNFDKEKLLDAIRKVAEEINYDGYMDGETSLVFKGVGTVPIVPTTHLIHPFVFAKPIWDCEEVVNYVLPWGDIESGVPPDMDRWTEDHDRWTDLWVADSNSTVTDDSGTKVYGAKSIKVTNTSGNNIGATLDITKDPKWPSGVDCSGGRFVRIRMLLRHDFTTKQLLDPTIDLIDSNDKTIRFGKGDGYLWFHRGLTHSKWCNRAKSIGPGESVEATYLLHNNRLNWWYGTGDSAFSWIIKKVRVWAGHLVAELKSMWVDALFFEGGLAIDPIRNSSFYPSPGVPIYDSGSIASYGRRLLHHQDHEVRSFEQAYHSGLRAVYANRYPIEKMVVKKGAAPYARPHQYVSSLVIPEYNIDAQWRILELAHDWQSRGNLLRTTFTMVPQTLKIGTEAARQDSIAGLLRGLK